MIAKPPQLVFDLPHRPSLGGDDFLVADCNRDAVLWVDAWPDWPAPFLCLYGPAACGKTHLAAVWQQRSQAQILGPADLDHWNEDLLTQPARWLIDDVAAIIGRRETEENLFHLYNHCKSTGGTLLITALTPPGQWSFLVADLASRLRSCPAVAIGKPDDHLLAGVMLKLFSDRQLRIAPDVIDYIVPRLERSFAAIVTLVEQLDHLSLSRGRAVTVPMARQVLDAWVAPDLFTAPLPLRLIGPSQGRYRSMLHHRQSPGCRG